MFHNMGLMHLGQAKNTVVYQEPLLLTCLQDTWGSQLASLSTELPYNLEEAAPLNQVATSNEHPFS